MTLNNEQCFEAAAQYLTHANRILVLTGAGISKASGIPTYRDAGGIWDTPENLKFSHVDAYRKDPAGFQKFWKSRLQKIGLAKPNPAHYALQELQAWKPHTLLVTQNVDGLLTAAGCVDVLELHGNFATCRCGKCGSGGPSVLNRCVKCFGRMRPNVVLFGETLPEDTINTALQAASKVDLVLVAGTSAVVYPAAALPEIALRFGAKLVVVDAEPTLLSFSSHVTVLGAAEVLLPVLVRAAQG